MHQQPSRRALLSMTHPNKELFFRQRALLRRTVPAAFHRLPMTI